MKKFLVDWPANMVFCRLQSNLPSLNFIVLMGSDNSALVSVSRGDKFLLEKDTRLLYVALTRAKKSLYMVNQ